VSEKRLVTNAEADAWALYHARWNDGAEYIEVPPDDYVALLVTREALIEALEDIDTRISTGLWAPVSVGHARVGALLDELRGDS
jgi:hypothetical protein